MAAKRKRKPSGPEFTSVALRVEAHKIAVGVGVHYDARASRARFSRPDDLLFEPSASIEIAGVCIDPPARLNNRYEITVYRDARKAKGPTLREIQKRDSDGLPLYRQYRDETLPVYNYTGGIGSLNNDRASQTWSSWTSVAPEVLTNMITLLGHGTPLYLSVLESKHNRYRSLERISLQTSNPMDE